MNLPNLNNDVLNIIGDYIKRENVKQVIFQRADIWINYLKKKNRVDRHDMVWLVWHKLFDCDDGEINEYIETRDLNNFLMNNILIYFKSKLY